MKKILYVADAYKMGRAPLDFAGFMCHLLNAKLEGMFLQPVPQDAASKAALQEELICSGGAVSRDMPLEEAKKSCAGQTLSIFRSACEELGINSTSVMVDGDALRGILLEARYADLMLIDPALSLSTPSAGNSPAMIREILSAAECPVILAPERFGGLEEIVFAYDGSPSAVFAIKQCRALFPRLADRKVTVLTAQGEKKVSREELQKMSAWLHANFADVSFADLGADCRSGLLEYVLGKEKLMVVMGAFGRSGWSAFFSASHAEPLARYVSKALFVTHL